MKYLFHLVVLIFVVGLATSCSTPGTESNSSALTSDADVVDITAQQASTLPSPIDIKPAIDGVDQLKETVSPGNLPKCVDQFSGAKKVWEKMKEVTGYYGEQKYMFDLGDRGYINGNPMTDMGAAVTPVPLFKTWNTEEITGVQEVNDFISHGAMVRVTGRRRSAEGNWYDVKIMSGGLEEIKGWVPEKLISTGRAMPSGGWGNLSPTAAACSTGG
jgi:hypothetical protein